MDELAESSNGIKSSGIASSSVLLKGVKLRPGVTADINVNIYRRPGFCLGKHVLAVHGITAGASCWKPLAERLLTHSYKGSRICKVAAIDQAGHGKSSLPNGVLFEQLMTEDYVATVFEVLDRLKYHNVFPSTLVGHSTGGMVIPMAQSALKAKGTSLFARYGITRAVLLAPVVPRPVPWPYLSSGAAGALATQFLAYSPARGAHIAAPAPGYQAVWWSDRNGQLVSNAPSVQTITQNGYNQPEALWVVGQLVENPPLVRPTVPPDIFGLQTGTLLHIVAFDQDYMLGPEVQKPLFDHLLKCKLFSRFTRVKSATAVHGSYLSEPDAILAAMSWKGFLLF